MNVAAALLILATLVVGCVLIYADIEQECRFQQGDK